MDYVAWLIFGSYGVAFAGCLVLCAYRMRRG